MTRRRLFITSCALGVLGAIAMAIGFVVAPTQAAFSYLTAWAFAVSVALGALIFLMIGYATGARWVVVFRRFTEAIVGAFPVLAVLFIPIAVSLDWLYPWVTPSRSLGGEELERIAHRAGYMNVPFFLVRAVVFLGAWTLLGELLIRWRREPRRPRVLSAAGLPALALTLTFAAIDWLMSLTPNWYSTIFGLLYFAGGFVAALGLIAVIARIARRIPIVASSIHASHTSAVGRLMFAFVVFWAYMEFSQGVIIWIANKPDEVPWYVARGAGLWGGIFGTLLIGHFVLPFFAMLPREIKRRPTLLAIAGGWIVAMHYLDIYWLVMPVLHKLPALHVLDIAAPCMVLGISAAVVIARSDRPIAEDDPDFPVALTYEATS